MKTEVTFPCSVTGSYYTGEKHVFTFENPEDFLSFEEKHNMESSEPFSNDDWVKLLILTKTYLPKLAARMAAGIKDCAEYYTEEQLTKFLEALEN